MSYNFNDAAFSKWFSRNLKPMTNEKKEAKSHRCYLCGNNCSSFCNSHTLPRFILENLSPCGTYSNFAAVSDISFIKPQIGTNKAGTFFLICNECDSKYFRDYEDKNNYTNLSVEFNQPFLYQIAIKNLLFQIYKANYELSLVSVLNNPSYSSKTDFCHLPDTINKHLKESLAQTCYRLKCYENAFKYDRHCYDNKRKGFKIMFQKELQYRVPVGVQTVVPIHKGFDGNIINDFKEEIMHFLHFCIFPLENRSLILLFCHSADDKYAEFTNAFKEKDEQEQLITLNYLLFYHSEDFFCDTNTCNVIKNDENLKKLSRKVENCDLSLPRIEIPNLLSKEYALNI
jgi:hypothetical protein